MEPSEEVRKWVSELMGMPAEEGRLSRSLTPWAILGPAITAVHAATIPAETEPAIQMVFPGLESPQSEGSRGDPQ
jgi:hypothetical protein